MRCKATTNYADFGSPTQCRRNATHGDYCWQHRLTGQPENTPTGKLYLIDTNDDRVIAGPAMDPKYLLNVAEEEVTGGTEPCHLRIVATVYSFDIESVNLKLTEA